MALWHVHLSQGWANSGLLPNVARHSVFSGPRKHSGNMFNLKFAPTYHIKCSAEANLTKTCFYFH